MSLEAGTAGTVGSSGGTDGPETGAQCPWGRVAVDGTVYVRTGDGERVAGSWQAGPPTEGLRHYRRRFADLTTEVDLLDRRTDSGAAEPKTTLAAVDRLVASLATAAVVGDLAGVAERLETVRAKAQHRLAEGRARRASEAQEASARKEILVGEAEALAESSTQWKAAGERLREIAAGWNTVRATDRKADASQWKRLAAARAAFNRRRGAHFAQLDVQRKEAEGRKKELVAEAEALAPSTEWGPAARRYKDLMVAWKAAPRAGREAEEELWQRFRTAQDGFFQRRSAVFAERDAAGRENQLAKERIVAKVEQLDVGNAKLAQERLRGLQESYDQGGPVPREAVAALDARMRAGEQRVQSAVDGARQRASAPANPLIDQMREQVAKAETQAAKARAAGDEVAVRDAEASLARRRAFLSTAERAVR